MKMNLNENTHSNFNNATINLNEDEYLIRQKNVYKIIKNNIWGCDLIICLFISALYSFKANQCVKPFPQFYVNDEGKDFVSLRNICNTIPPIKKIIDAPEECSYKIFELLEWLFLGAGLPTLKRISFNDVVFPSEIALGFKPHYIFKVQHSQRYEDIWEKRVGCRKTFVAYHGSSTDNFFSIIKFGLQQSFSIGKELLFGNGIYLSNELSVSIHYAPFRQTWKCSSMGSKHSIIALCEIIDDDEKVKSQDSRNSKKNMGIPEKYFVVTDSDLVKIKYLLVYKKDSVLPKKTNFYYFVFLMLLFFYCIFNVSLRVYNEETFSKLFRWLPQLL